MTQTPILPAQPLPQKRGRAPKFHPPCTHCRRPATGARGLCSRDYRRWKRGDPSIVPEVQQDQKTPPAPGLQATLPRMPGTVQDQRTMRFSLRPEAPGPPPGQMHHPPVPTTPQTPRQALLPRPRRLRRPQMQTAQQGQKALQKALSESLPGTQRPQGEREAKSPSRRIRLQRRRMDHTGPPRPGGPKKVHHGPDRAPPPRAVRMQPRPSRPLPEMRRRPYPSPSQRHIATCNSRQREKPYRPPDQPDAQDLRPERHSPPTPHGLTPEPRWPYPNPPRRARLWHPQPPIR